MLKKYLLNTSGNFGIMFALFSTVLILGAGIVVDYAGMINQRTKLQNVIDAAALAAATSGKKDINEIQKIVDERVALLNAEGINITASAHFENGDLVIDSSSEYTTFLLGTALKLMGNNSDGILDIGASTAAPIATQDYINIALVLDTTDSMQGSNIDGLKVAADSLLDDLSAFGDNVKVSVVPFGQYVNIESQRGQDWLDLDKEAQVDRFINRPSDRRTVIKPRECTPTGNMIPGEIIYQDGVEIGQEPDQEEQVCTPAEYGPPETINRNYDLNYRWNGCAGSRDTPNNARADFDGINIPGAMEAFYTGDLTHVQREADCGDEMLPLGNDFGKMKSLIAGLTTSGDTYLPSGLLWGWRALTPEAPFTEAASSPDDTTSIMIFMTDGFNTLSQDDEYHDGNQRENGYDVAQDICKNINDDKIDVYTVAYNLPNVDAANDTRRLLKQCASDLSKTFEAQNGAQLTGAFKEIVGRLGSIRLKYRPS